MEGLDIKAGQPGENPIFAPSPGGRVDNVGAAFNKGRLTTPAFVVNVLCIALLFGAFFIGFLMIFFFVAGSMVEQNIVRTSAQGFVTQLFNDATFLLSKEQVDSIRAAVGATQLPDMSKDDDEANQRNAKVKKDAFIKYGTVAGVLALIVVVLYFGFRAAMKKKYGSSAKAGVHYPGWTFILVMFISLAAVAGVELAFLYGVLNRYQPLDDYAVKKSIIDTVIADITNA
jgi:hypothetical protein